MPSCRPWTMKIDETTYEPGPPVPYRFRHHRADETSLSFVLNKHPATTVWCLEYDYGTSTFYTVTFLSAEVINDALSASDFPRRKPEAVVPHTVFTTPRDKDLAVSYPQFNKWFLAHYTRHEQRAEVNLFQAGRKRVHGYYSQADRGIHRTMLLPAKAASLSHYLALVEAGAAIDPCVGYSRHSVVVLTDPTSTGTKKYFDRCLAPGFIDCLVVENSIYRTDWDSIFPNIAALAGFRKKKSIPRGWIRYANEVLVIVTGAGSPCSLKAPKRTAFDGKGCHIPQDSDMVLFKVQQSFASIHELFCKVEGLLGTL